MNTSTFFGFLAVAVSTLAMAAATPVKADEHDGHFAKCAKICAECQVMCDSCFHHCAEQVKAGKKEHAKTMHLCVDCAELCSTAARLCARHSPLSGTACDACAKACDVCAAACEMHPNDKHMAACAKMCRDCAKECKAMAKHAAH